jgi:hypothetical protein
MKEMAALWVYGKSRLSNWYSVTTGEVVLCSRWSHG